MSFFAYLGLLALTVGLGKTFYLVQSRGKEIKVLQRQITLIELRQRNLVLEMARSNRV